MGLDTVDYTDGIAEVNRKDQAWVRMVSKTSKEGSHVLFWLLKKHRVTVENFGKIQEV